MSKLDRKIEEWKNSLLDLGKRNRLLNYRKTKRMNIEIETPNIEELYSSLVLDEKSMDFTYSYYDENEEGEKKEIVIEGDLTTNRILGEQQKTLRNLRARAKTSIEEKGVNVLYLAMGFLNWTEKIGSQWELMSPLILVPVSITVESLISPYVLSLHEDEIVVNPTLSYKLDNDFGIKLPLFDAYEDDIIEYLNDIHNLVKVNGWTIKQECGLSLFSFLKMNMYFDLDMHRDKIESNPILQALAGDPSEIASVPEKYNDYNHDENVKPIDTFQVVDADSSQQDAILYSKQGISFILQGPPGTGKSQTITNIIAEALADGKKVLFVSEKMAALEVVHKRLTESELSDFCLMLHSHKANKKEVLSELNKTLSLDKIELHDEAFYKLNVLEKKRNSLNEYVDSIHIKCHPLNKTIYEATGILSKLENIKDVVFEIENVEQIDTDKLHNILYLIDTYSKTVGEMSFSFNENPWRGVLLENLTHTERQNIENNIEELLPVIKEISTYINSLIIEQKIGIVTSINGINQLKEIYNKISNCPGVPSEWVLLDDIKPLLASAEEYNGLKKIYSSDQKYITSDFHEEIIQHNGLNIKNNIDVAWLKINKYLINSIKNEYIDNRSNKIKKIVDKKEKLESLTDDVEYLNQIGIDVTEDYMGIEKVTPILNLLSVEMYPTEDWFEAQTLAKEMKLSEEFEKRFATIDSLRKAILDEYDKEIFKIDYLGMLKRFRTEYTSFTKIFKKEYKKDKKIIQSHSLIIQKKIDDSTVLNLLTNLRELEDNIMWVEDNEKEIENFLGGQYLGEDTNWEQVKNSINNFDLLRHELGIFPAKVQENMLSFKMDTKIINQIKINFEEALSEQSKDVMFETFDKSLETFTDINEKLDLLLKETNEINNIINLINSYSNSPKNYDEINKLIDKLISVQEIDMKVKKNEESLREQFATEYHGLDTDWDNVKNQLDWVSDYKEAVKDVVLTDEFIINSCENTEFQKKCAEFTSKIEAMLLQTSEKWNLYRGIFDDKQEFNAQDIDKVSERMEECVNSMSALEEWIDFRQSRKKCDDIGLGNFIDECNKVGIKASDLKEAYLKRFYRSWLDIMIPKYPAVNSFRRRNHESLIEEFNALDKLQLDIVRSRIREKLIRELPDINRTISARDEVAILRRELNKKRRIMPLRRLFKEIPNLLMTLKPCLMMSPLSVSLFLQADSYEFDIVVFDEASQIQTENAIGAIMRGKQVVIAGDTKQLPPTNFFVGATSDSDFDSDSEEDYEETGNYESVLDEINNILPDRTLKWHYRSKNESLIAFSNAKIYNHSLITFPSPIEDDLDNGVEYVFVENGVYDRGGKKNNIKEAEKVVELIFRHIKNTPHRSLGVITFSESQQYAIETALRNKRIKKPQYEDFFNEENPEAFFVKNLENVQGDERDSIIFSIGYAKDSKGQMYMNFGPLSREGGYRRLNVAITRAKYNIKLVGSIRPTDIRVENINSEGVKMLRSYIEFAIHGKKTLENELNVPEIVSVESPFEEAVYDYLIKHGYEVSTQVGCSGYRIDMAVKHPRLSGRYVLGVECDGATYHSSRTARERDRIRQTVLEDIGWKIYRIWSTDWIKDLKTEGENLVYAVEEAINSYVEDEIIAEELQKTEEEDNKNYEIQVEKIDIDSNNQNESKFEEYEEADIWRVERGYDDNLYLIDVVNYVVSIESPIHFDLLCKRVAPLFGNQKATSKVRNGVEYVLMNYENNVIKKGDFYWNKKSTEIRVRKPSKNVSRPIQYIATEELIEAIKKVIDNSFGIQKEDLFITVARIFGFSRTGGKIQTALSKAFNQMEVEGMVSIVDGKVAIS